MEIFEIQDVVSKNLKLHGDKSSFKMIYSIFRLFIGKLVLYLNILN
jgi:hypothetical protein